MRLSSNSVAACSRTLVDFSTCGLSRRSDPPPARSNETRAEKARCLVLPRSGEHRTDVDRTQTDPLSRSRSTTLAPPEDFDAMNDAPVGADTRSRQKSSSFDRIVARNIPESHSGPLSFQAPARDSAPGYVLKRLTKFSFTSHSQARECYAYTFPTIPPAIEAKAVLPAGVSKAPTFLNTMSARTSSTTPKSCRHLTLSSKT